MRLRTYYYTHIQLDAGERFAATIGSAGVLQARAPRCPLIFSASGPSIIAAVQDASALSIKKIPMKAMLSKSPGGPETLELSDIDMAVPGPTQVRIRVHACGINYPDLLIIKDEYQFKPPRPFSPGCEVAGVIDAVGAEAVGWRAGDRVIATMICGGLAEYVTVAADTAIPLPNACDFVQGAALLLAYGTTIHALVDRGRLNAGETLLVLGASGGVGLAAVDVGKALGAKVIAAVSSSAKAEAAIAAGADDAVIYGRAPFDREQQKHLSTAFKKAIGAAGADVIYDPVGGDYAEPALRSIAWLGRYLVIGFAAGIPKLPLNLALLKGCDIRGVFWGEWATREPVANRKNVDRLLDWFERGVINPRVSGTWPLDRAADAIMQLASREAIGKVVVTIA
jgi:NADPH:quinone reductase